MRLTEQEKNRILSLHTNSKNVNGSLITEQYTWKGPVDMTDELIARGQVGMSDDLRDWEAQSDSVKNIFFCLDGREYRDYGFDEPTYERFLWLWQSIEGKAGTDEDGVYQAISSWCNEENRKGCPKFTDKGKYTISDLEKFKPILQCMKTKEPWKNDFTKTDVSVWSWILDDFSGIEKCYLQAFMNGKGRGDCDTKHGYFWWNKASNFIKGLF